MAKDFGRIAVLCGGPGGEREVSLNSGQEVYAALERSGIACTKVVLPQENPDTFLEGVDCDLAVMMLHGEFGEDGDAQEILERRGIVFTGSSSDACRRAMNKTATKILMKNAGIPTPRWTTSKDPEKAAAAVVEAGLAYPLFVKPNYGGSSVGVSRAETPYQLRDAVAKALEDDRLALIEEMIWGRELTAGWLDGRLLPIIELNAQNEFYDYQAKYLSDATRYTCPAELDAGAAKAIGRHVLATVAAIGARDLARVDIMLGSDGPMLLELNTLPGFTTHSLLPMAAARDGLPMEELCVKLVDMAASRTEGGRK